MRNKLGSLLVLLAGIFWGTMGIFVRTLTDMGFSSVQIVAFRFVVAFVGFWIVLMIADPKGAKIQKKDIVLFLGLGLGSVLMYAICYFTAIQMMSLSVAAILLYTSPVWVTIMAALFFKEKMTKIKSLALVLAFVGCVLVSGIGGAQISVIGLILGLISGVTYGLYSILGTIALRKYSTFTVTTYTFTLAAIGAVIFCNPVDAVKKIQAVPDFGFFLFFAILTGIVTSIIPYLLYTAGLRRMEAGKAAILATAEPLVATILGALIYGEVIGILSGIGIGCILAAILMLNLKIQNRKPK